MEGAAAMLVMRSCSMYSQGPVHIPLVHHHDAATTAQVGQELGVAAADMEQRHGQQRGRLEAPLQHGANESRRCDMAAAMAAHSMLYSAWQIARWVEAAPLGLPLVPEVYMIMRQVIAVDSHRRRRLARWKSATKAARPLGSSGFVGAGDHRIDALLPASSPATPS